MINLLAQAVDPSEWAKLADRIGPNAFVAVVVILGVGWLIHKGLSWTVGKEGCFREAIQTVTKRIVALADSLETSALSTTTTLKAHMDSCDRIHVTGGPCNVIQIEAAGHHAAEALRMIGQGKPCDAQADAIHTALRDARSTPHTDNMNVGQTITEQAR